MSTPPVPFTAPRWFVNILIGTCIGCGAILIVGLADAIGDFLVQLAL